MKTAMILAAGRGERLRPLTDSTPKALCRVHHVPLIQYHVANLAQAGFEHIVINHAWLGGQIRQHLGNGSRWGIEIDYAPEPPGGLETGGGIFNALPLLGDKPFLTVNADVYTDYDFNTLSSLVSGLLLPDGRGSVLSGETMVRLVLINKPDYATQGDFGLSAEGIIDNNNRQYTFAGIACYQPDVFKNLTPGRYSVTPILRQLASKRQLTGEVYNGKWLDIGTLDRLHLAT